MVALAIGGLVMAGAPFAARAQSGDALAHAERACSNSGVPPYSNAFKSCVDRTAADFRRGAPNVAYDTAQAIGDASRVCASYGIDQRSLGYAQCIDAEISRDPDTVQALTALDDTPHVAVTVDRYGFGHDAEGNLLDAHGLVIKPVPMQP
jgi:hypothetical protein